MEHMDFLFDNEHYGEADFLQVVLLGRTGSGKSSLANTLFGEQSEFKVSHFAGSETKLCQTKTKTVNGRKLRLIDTPGLFDTELNNTELSPEEVKVPLESAPGVHAFLILLKVDRFTVHEKEITGSLFKSFGKDALKYSTVIFTHGDQLPEGMTIEEWVEQNDGVKNLVQKCGGRCHVFDNKYWNQEHPYRSNQVQVENLLNTIEETVRINGGQCYTNEALVMLEREIQEATLQINESSPGDDAQSKRNKAKELVKNKLWPKMKGSPAGCAIGLLVGTALVPLLIPGLITGAVVAGATAATSVTGGLAGIVPKLTKERNHFKRS